MSDEFRTYTMTYRELLLLIKADTCTENNIEDWLVEDASFDDHGMALIIKER